MQTINFRGVTAIGIINIEVKDPFGNLLGRTAVTDDGWVKISAVLDGTAGLDLKGTAGVDLNGTAGVYLKGTAGIDVSNSKDRPFSVEINGAAKPLPVRLDATALIDGMGADAPIALDPITLKIRKTAVNPNIGVSFKLFGLFTLFSIGINGTAEIEPQS